MTTDQPKPSLYQRYGFLLVIFIGIIAATGIWVGASAGVTAARAEEGNAKLIDCLNDYAAEDSKASTAIRDASVAKDLKLAEFYVALDAEGQEFLDFINKLYAGKAEGVDDIVPLRKSLDARDDASAELLVAQQNLDQVRKDNPIPPSPVVFCELEIEEKREG